MPGIKRKGGRGSVCTSFFPLVVPGEEVAPHMDDERRTPRVNVRRGCSAEPNDGDVDYRGNARKKPRARTGGGAVATDIARG
ncbi:hypothetical protein HPB50_009773 [Hyalomma asiaticum]|uniref:Uncharacterized protein n=1 Tax=Hyalomma asiaticum TaxID=266040 RepID=A0ACB7S1H6_HYAAI|nr:hypothetical protein HPB50_009773 [Hyalomma asiaticum]